MIIVLLFLTGISIAIIYNTINSGKRTLLKDLCENQTEVIKSIYKETKDTKAVLDVLYKQKEITKGLGKTGEYTIGYEKNDSIFFY